MICSRIVSSSLRNLKSIIWPRWAVSSSLQSLEIVTWRATAVPVITVAIYQREAREIWSRATTEAPAADSAAAARLWILPATTAALLIESATVAAAATAAAGMVWIHGQQQRRGRLRRKFAVLR
jgi:hypothetical protein